MIDNININVVETIISYLMVIDDVIYFKGGDIDTSGNFKETDCKILLGLNILEAITSERPNIHNVIYTLDNDYKDRLTTLKRKINIDKLIPE